MSSRRALAFVTGVLLAWSTLAVSLACGGSGGAVVTVDDAEISRSHLARRVLQFVNRGGAQELRTTNQDVIAVHVAQRMRDELVLVERGGLLGVDVADAEIDEVVGARGALPAEPTDEQLGEAYRRQVTQSQLKIDEFKFQIRASLLENKAGEVLLGSQETAPQRRIRMIRTETFADAERARELILAGQAFGEVALTLSNEPESRYRNGELPFSVRYEFAEALRDAAFELEPGVLSSVIAPADGTQHFYIIEVLEADDDRGLEEHQRRPAGRELVARWIDEQVDAGGVEFTLSGEDRRQVFREIRDRIAVQPGR